jgi:uncharacterized protein YeaO (DUF488 family)
MNTLRIKRIYDPWDDSDGYRILSDRLWPRGISRAEARLNEWAKDFAPSSQLRREVHQNDIPWDEFTLKYQQELARNPEFVRWSAALKNLLLSGNVTLITAAKLQPHSHADILKAAMEKNMQA